MQDIQRTQDTSIAMNSTRLQLEVYGIAFGLHTVFQHQWKYDVNGLTRLKDFDLLTHYKKRQLCETALHSLGYDPTKIPSKADPAYGHVQLDASGGADAEDYDAQISALMEGRTPPSLGPSSYLVLRLWV